MHIKGDISRSDAELVEAARRGESERYGELVERYERRAFGVAWSRLGDPHLAEEATQEAFIRAYRQISLLSDGAKFASWLLSIVRNTAINLGIRHRRELEKRERWAIEPTAPLTPQDDAEREICSLETLRRTLSELPEKHRECLVLFYIEGRSGAETATALGLSEAAFRVRLHRARAALRERLEENLAKSLDQLRPSKPIPPLVLAGILLAPSAKAATGGAAIGLGAKVASSIGKAFSLGWIVPLLPLVGALPGIVLARFLGRLERRNYRDTEGFRARLHDDFFRSFVWGFPLLLLMALVLTQLPGYAWGATGSKVVLLGFLLLCFVVPLRMLVINRSRFAVGTMLYCAILFFGAGADLLGLLPPQATGFPFIAATVLYALFLKDRPTRMDYSLFLRAAQNLLQKPDSAERTSPGKPDRKALRAFAGFLGERWLASGYRWTRDGLALRLMPVKSSLLRNVVGTFAPMTTASSHIVLRADGSVAAHCSTRDLADLRSMLGEETPTKGELESTAADAVNDAWRNFEAGNTPNAARALGETSELDVFVVPTRRAASTRWARGTLIAGAILLTVLMLANWERERLSFVAGRKLKTVHLTEPEIRTAIEALSSRLANDPDKREVLYVLSVSHVLPPTNLFTQEAWIALKPQFHNPAAPPGDRGSSIERAEMFLSYSHHPRLFANGWFALHDLGFARADLERAIEEARPQQRELWFSVPRMKVSSRDGMALSHTVLDTSRLPWLLYSLKRLDLVQLVSTELDVLAGLLLRQQILSREVPTHQRQDLDPRLLHGTFVTLGQNPIQDTWQALTILDAAGKLDRIDRKACIDGILRFHHGKGLFGSVRKEDGFVIFGDTRDTFCAFESLRMLGALDRVEDLERWRFRPGFWSRKNTEVSWPHLEAWVCEQRFARIMRERKNNPFLPVRSLLEP